MGQSRSVLEYAANTGPRSVDRAEGIIRHVKVLGLESANGYTYLPEAIKAGARLYNGRQVFIAHPARGSADAERSPADLFGWLARAVVESDGIYADLHYLKTHPLASQVVELAERAPDKLGLSHNAVVTEATRGGKAVIESIVRVRSVDLVCRPATTRGLFESLATDTATSHGWFDIFASKAESIIRGDGKPQEKASMIQAVLRAVLTAQSETEGGVITPADADDALADAMGVADLKKFHDANARESVGKPSRKAAFASANAGLKATDVREIARRSSEIIEGTQPARRSRSLLAIWDAANRRLRG